MSSVTSRPVAGGEFEGVLEEFVLGVEVGDGIGGSVGGARGGGDERGAGGGEEGDGSRWVHGLPGRYPGKPGAM